MWVATQDLPRTAAHPFYARLNQILDKADFDGYVASLCQRFYADEIGRPGLAPGRYFRLSLVGYFEGLDAERAIAWRGGFLCAARVSRTWCWQRRPVPGNQKRNRQRDEQAGRFHDYRAVIADVSGSKAVRGWGGFVLKLRSRRATGTPSSASGCTRCTADGTGVPLVVGSATDAP
jgi:hypothetical protein